MLSTSIEEIILLILRNTENRLRNHVEGKSNDFEDLGDIHKYLEAWNEKENKRILIYKVMHQGLEIPSDKHMEEL